MTGKMPLTKSYGNDFDSSRADASLYCKAGESLFEMLLRVKKEQADKEKEKVEQGTEDKI